MKELKKIDYKTYDNSMKAPARQKKIAFAKSQGYSTYNEMIHRKHILEEMGGTEISIFIYENSDLPQKLNITPSSVLYSLKSMGCFEYRNPKRRGTIGRRTDDTCTCCKRAAKDPEFTFLCRRCWVNGGILHR